MSDRLRPASDLPQAWRGMIKLLFVVEAIAIAWFALMGQPAQAAIQHVLGVDDHAMHMAAFLVASSTALLVWAPAAAVAILLAAAAVSIELVQAYIPGRYPSAIDFAASGVGILAGIMVARWVWPRLLLRSNPT